jgi:hypothetical protein
MDIPVYLNRPHKDPDDITGKAVLGKDAYAKLPENEAEMWIENGWATPVDPDRFYAHLEAKQADPVGYAKVQEESLIEAKAQAVADCAERKRVRPSLAVLARRKAELRAKCEADRVEAAKKAGAEGALGRAAAVVGGTIPTLVTDDLED